MTGQDLDPDIYENLSGLISDMAYNPDVSRRMLDEQDDPYTEWLQDRSQLGSGQRSRRRNRRNRRNRRSKSRRSYTRRKYMY